MDIQKASEMRFISMRVTYILIFVSIILFMSVEVFSDEDDISKRIKKIEKDIEKVKKELDKGEKKLKKLKSNEKKILAELDLSEKKIETIHSSLRIIKNEEKLLRSDIIKSGKNYNNSAKNFESRSESYAERLRSMYKRHNISPLGMFFSAGSISSVLRGLKMLSVLATADLDILHDMRTQIHEMKSSMTTLQSALNANIELTRTRKREQNSLDNTRNKKRKLLEEILQDEKLQEARNRKYLEEYKKSQSKLDNAISVRERARPPLPPSLEGYNFATFKGKLIWPVNGKVVSKFGRVVDSRTKTTTNNRGIEIDTNLGEPISSIGDGQIVMTQFLRGYGNFVMIHHPPNFYTIYGHLSDILVNKDQVVSAGGIIGLAGNTGMIDNSSSRLVLEVLKGDKPENPLVWLRPSSQRAGR